MYGYSLPQLQLCMLPALKIHRLQGSTLFRNCLSATARVWVGAAVEAESIASITLSVKTAEWNPPSYAVLVATQRLAVWLSVCGPFLPL